MNATGAGRPPPPTIRRARRDDLPTLGRLGALLMRVHYEFDRRRFMAPGANPEQGYARFLATQLDDDEVVILVAEREAEVIGYVYAGVEPLSWKELRERAGFIHDLVVADRARRAGTARALIDAAVDWLRGRGVPRVMLWTAEPNDAAQRLFAGAGFRWTMIEMTRELE